MWNKLDRFGKNSANHMLEYSFTVSGRQDKRAPLVNVEYHTNSFPPLEEVHDHEMPCSVCMAPGRITKLMVPGKKDLPYPRLDPRVLGVLTEF